MPATRSSKRKYSQLDFGDEACESSQAIQDTGYDARITSFFTKLERFKHHDENLTPPGDIQGQSTIVRSGANGDTTAEHHNEPENPQCTKISPKPYLAMKNVVLPPKKPTTAARYAPPSKYSHLPLLQDVLEPNLVCVFVGTNPGIRTATAGHAYAHPSNLFWKLLHSSGCTDERLRPEQDRDLPRLYSMGNTNIVARPSRDAAELSKAEMAAGTPILDEKFSKYQPEAVCIVGKGIWEAIWRWRHNRQIRKDEFKYGWQDDRYRMGKTKGWRGARVFVATSTSGLSASLSLEEKEAIWRPFGEWVKTRRAERASEDN